MLNILECLSYITYDVDFPSSCISRWKFRKKFPFIQSSDSKASAMYPSRAILEIDLRLGGRKRACVWKYFLLPLLCSFPSSSATVATYNFCYYQFLRYFRFQHKFPFIQVYSHTTTLFHILDLTHPPISSKSPESSSTSVTSTDIWN